MRAIIQCEWVIPEIPSILTMVRPYMEFFCKSKGYEYIVDDLRYEYRYPDWRRCVLWEKYYRIIKYCEENPIGTFGVYLDGDAVPIGNDCMEYALGGSDLGLTRFNGGRYCDGVIFFRVQEWTKQLFKATLAYGERYESCHSYGFSTEFAFNRLLEGNTQVKELDSRWNFFGRSPRCTPPMQIVAWHGERWGAKVNQIKKLLESIKWPQAE